MSFCVRCEYTEWFQVARDRLQWRNIVNILVFFEIVSYQTVLGFRFKWIYLIGLRNNLTEKYFFLHYWHVGSIKNGNLFTSWVTVLSFSNWTVHSLNITFVGYVIFRLLFLLLLLSVGLSVANAPDVPQPCGLLYYPWCSNSHHQSSSRDPGSQSWS